MVASITLDYRTRQKIISLFVDTFTNQVVEPEDFSFTETRREVIERAVEGLVVKEWPLDKLGYLLFQLGEVLGQLCQRFRLSIQGEGRSHLYSELQSMLKL